MADQRQRSEIPRSLTRVENSSSGEAEIAVERIPARDPFVRKVAVVVLFAVVVGLLATVFVLGIQVLLAAFAGVLLAVLLLALADLLARYLPLPRGATLAIVILLILALLGVGGFLLAPQVVEQAENASERIPEMIGEAQEFLQERGWGQWVLEQMQGAEMEGGMGGGIGTALGGLLSAITYFLVVIFVGLFAAVNPELYQDGIVRFFPLRHRPRAREVIGELGYTLRWWLIGRAVAMTAVGVTTAIVLGLLGIEFALLLGLIAGLLTFVPYLGPIAAGVPIILFALMEGPEQALWATLAYFVIQQVEGNVLDPLIMHKLVYIPPVTTIIMQVLMGAVAGVMGIAMATPLAAVLIVLTKVYRQDILGEPRDEDDDDEEDEEDSDEED